MSDAVPLLEVGDGRERISPLLTRRRPCSIWSDDAAPWRPPTTRDRRGLGSSDGAAQRWGALAGDAGAEMGGRDGRSWMSRGGRAATAGALDAPGLGVHRGGVGAASGRSCRCRGVGTPQGTGRSCRSTAAVGGRSSTRFLFRPGHFF